MFGLFKKKSALEKLEIAYKNKLEEAFKLQSVNRSLSDNKYAEAEEIANKIALAKKEKK